LRGVFRTEEIAILVEERRDDRFDGHRCSLSEGLGRRRQHRARARGIAILGTGQSPMGQRAPRDRASPAAVDLVIACSLRAKRGWAGLFSGALDWCIAARLSALSVNLGRLEEARGVVQQT
jgi:hypothetical protein